MADYAQPDVLVTTDWVAEHVNDTASVRLVEANEDVLLYETGHIPNAVKIDWVQDLQDDTVNRITGERADAELAARDQARTEQLAERDLASAAELDTARSQAEARRAAVAVATARVAQREAALAGARVQLGYTRVRAAWSGDDAARVVGEIARIAPRFAEDSRQARFEVRLANEDRALKPGMFVTVRVTVATASDAVLVPAEAVVRRGDGAGVYRVEPGDPARVRFMPVRLGIQGDEHVQVVSPALSGQVVTLGQQLLEDGAPVIVSTLPAS